MSFRTRTPRKVKILAQNLLQDDDHFIDLYNSQLTIIHQNSNQKLFQEMNKKQQKIKPSPIFKSNVERFILQNQNQNENPDQDFYIPKGVVKTQKNIRPIYRRKTQNETEMELQIKNVFENDPYYASKSPENQKEKKEKQIKKKFIDHQKLKKKYNQVLERLITKKDKTYDYIVDDCKWRPQEDVSYFFKEKQFENPLKPFKDMIQPELQYYKEKPIQQKDVCFLSKVKRFDTYMNDKLSPQHYSINYTPKIKNLINSKCPRFYMEKADLKPIIHGPFAVNYQYQPYTEHSFTQEDTTYQEKKQVTILPRIPLKNVVLEHKTDHSNLHLNFSQSTERQNHGNLVKGGKSMEIRDNHPVSERIKLDCHKKPLQKKLRIYIN